MAYYPLGQYTMLIEYLLINVHFSIFSLTKQFQSLFSFPTGSFDIKQCFQFLYLRIEIPPEHL